MFWWKVQPFCFAHHQWKAEKDCHVTYLILLLITNWKQKKLPCDVFDTFALFVTSLIQTAEHWHRLLSTDTDCWALTQTAELWHRLLSTDTGYWALTQTTEHWHRLLSFDTDCWALIQTSERWYRLLSTDTDCWALTQTAELWYRLLSIDTDCWALSIDTDCWALIQTTEHKMAALLVVFFNFLNVGFQQAGMRSCRVPVFVCFLFVIIVFLVDSSQCFFTPVPFN